MADSRPEGSVDGKAAREINEQIRYTMWSVFRARTDGERLPDDRTAVAAEAADFWPGWPPRTSSSAAPTTSPGCARTPTT